MTDPKISCQCGKLLSPRSEFCGPDGVTWAGGDPDVWYCSPECAPPIQDVPDVPDEPEPEAKPCPGCGKTPCPGLLLSPPGTLPSFLKGVKAVFGMDPGNMPMSMGKSIMAALPGAHMVAVPFGGAALFSGSRLSKTGWLKIPLPHSPVTATQARFRWTEERRRPHHLRCKRLAVSVAFLDYVECSHCSMALEHHHVFWKRLP